MYFTYESEIVSSNRLDKIAIIHYEPPDIHSLTLAPAHDEPVAWQTQGDVKTFSQLYRSSSCCSFASNAIG